MLEVNRLQGKKKEKLSLTSAEFADLRENLLSFSSQEPLISAFIDVE